MEIPAKDRGCPSVHSATDSQREGCSTTSGIADGRVQNQVASSTSGMTATPCGSPRGAPLVARPKVHFSQAFSQRAMAGFEIDVRTYEKALECIAQQYSKSGKSTGLDEGYIWQWWEDRILQGGTVGVSGLG